MLFQVSLLSEVEVRVERLSDLFLNFVSHITSFDMALVYVWAPQDAWFCRGLQGEIPDRIDQGNAFTAVVRETAKPLLVPDMHNACLDGHEIPFACHSMIALPIYKDTKIIGCLELYRKSAPGFDINDIILIKHLLLSSEKIIQQVIGNEPDYDEALDIRMDIPQRHVILDILLQYEELSKRLSFPLSVAILEIEDRDRFGLYQHLPEGVRTLKTLAKRIQDGLRRYDKVLRYEELSFFVILPGCSSQDAITALHNATLNLGADLANNMTMGIATLPDEAQDAKGLVNIAHQALSHAKKKGIHMARYSQTGALKQTNLSLELRMKRILQAGPHIGVLNELLDLLRIQCQADDLSIRKEPPGSPVSWQGNELGYLVHEGLPADVYEWLVSYITPAWAVALGLDPDTRNWYLGTLTTASILSDLRAGYPMGYSIKVADQMFTLAKEMGKGETQASIWANSALAANIGYLGIPTSIFTKGEITPFDKNKINTHTFIGSKMLKDVMVLNLDDDILMYHHENIDGSGYPRGLKGEDIPLGARALRVVDTYNAITSPRLYRFQLDQEQALREMCSMAGKSLDPEVTSLFVDLIGS
ncbi:MAG TPA: HD domain-containing phosphohydrolase [Deltaproteobacteria bacterium]|nr:HD domain-containing phosphohydrolase [Deltaproteobacteria bacterium]HOI07276.1 HD domain-containing phosphohydrolase [Deltaproteobacteria bacterium]